MSGIEPIVIVGCGGFGREVLDVVEALNSIRPTFQVAGFLDDLHDGSDDVVARRGVPVLGPVAMMGELGHRYAIGIGSPVARASIDRAVTEAGVEALTLVHPSATVGGDNRIAPGAVICSGARITTNVTVGRHLHLNLNSTIGHDCVVGDHVTVNPSVNVSGNVHLGDRVNMGTKSVVIPGIAIGEDAVIGAGAVVVRSVPAGVTAVGVPARPRSAA